MMKCRSEYEKMKEYGIAKRTVQEAKKIAEIKAYERVYAKSRIGVILSGLLLYHKPVTELCLYRKDRLMRWRTENMYCTRCGKEIRSDQKFCGNCGAKNVNYKEKNDLKEMIEKAAAGEENALEKIYNLTYVQGFAIALQMVKNEQDAMDVMQDAYISAFRNLKQIEDPKRLKSWFNCIVANKCKDWLKKKSQKRNMKRN